MTEFTKYTRETAPEKSKELLGEVADTFGGQVPNLFAYTAASPAALKAMLYLGKDMGKTSFTDSEEHTVLIASSVENRCEFCTAAHAGLLKEAGMPREHIEALKKSEMTGDARTDALATFTRQMTVKRGEVSQQELQAFLDAGFEKAQVFEVVLGVAYKAMTNYVNHIARTELNDFLTDEAPNFDKKAA